MDDQNQNPYTVQPQNLKPVDANSPNVQQPQIQSAAVQCSQPSDQVVLSGNTVFGGIISIILTVPAYIVLFRYFTKWDEPYGLYEL